MSTFGHCPHADATSEAREHTDMEKLFVFIEKIKAGLDKEMPCISDVCLRKRCHHKSPGGEQVFVKLAAGQPVAKLATPSTGEAATNRR